jgi:hypothetical protein
MKESLQLKPETEEEPLQMEALQFKSPPAKKAISSGDGAIQMKPFQMTNHPVQKQEEEPLQGRFVPIQRKKNTTGLSDNLKSGIEQLSGMDISDVKVHRNSDKPAQMQAHAYAQGTDIHVAPGQEKHLPHEAWHVVQQKQGRVQPTIQMQGVDVNTDSALEDEADFMGMRASNISAVESRLPTAETSAQSSRLLGQSQSTVQQKPVRQFKCGSSAPAPATATNTGVSSAPAKLPSRRNQAVLADIAETGNIINAEVALNEIRDKKGRITEFLTETISVQEYTMNDNANTFYTATGIAAAESILKVGLDPSYGGRAVNNISDWNSQGHVYFALDQKTCSTYATKMGYGSGNYAILKLTLPNGYRFTVDPEIPDGFRSTTLIPPGNIERV